MSTLAPIDYWVKRLGLINIGIGYITETHRSPITVFPKGQSQEEEGRSSCSSIYFLQERGQHGKLHSLQSDELYFYHKGAPQIVLYFDDNVESKLVRKVLGPYEDQHLQICVPAGKIMVQFVEETAKQEYYLGSIVVSPGFDPRDSTPANRNELIKKYPQHKDFIIKYT